MLGKQLRTSPSTGVSSAEATPVLGDPLEIMIADPDHQKADPRDNDDLRPEYDFSKGVRGKHQEAYKAGTNVVVLEPDVARVFRDSASVNRVLRLLLRLAKEHVPTG